MDDSETARSYLSDREWRNLLQRIEGGHVIPVVGPELVKIVDANGNDRSLQAVLAPQLAAALGFKEVSSFEQFNQVARAYLHRAHLHNEGSRDDLYPELRELYRYQLPATPSESLLALAGIEAFDLYITSTTDPMFARALQAERPTFNPKQDLLYFHPNGNSEPHPHPQGDPKNPRDLPFRYEGPLLYHILGMEASRDFAVWEEDYLEFLCSLLEQSDSVNELFTKLRSRDLLLLGAPAEDWIVRFFLRVARGERLSTASDHRDYLADARERLSEPMMFFFDKTVRTTRIIDGDPTGFVLELAKRWKKYRRGARDHEDFFARLSEECPVGAVFLSYAREDRSAIGQLGIALQNAGVPVWLDQRSLRPGENYEQSLQHAIKNVCGFFVSLISQASESSASRYVHNERRWAAQRHVNGFVFYLPIVLDLPPGTEPGLEPECFGQVERERWSAATFPRFVARVCDLYYKLRKGVRERG